MRSSLEINGFKWHGQISASLVLLFLAMSVVCVSGCPGRSNVFTGGISRQYDDFMREGEYYWLVKTGVSSRILGLQFADPNLPFATQIEENREEIGRLLGVVKQHWEDISEQPDAERLIDFLHANRMKPIAGAIEKTLEANADQEPTTQEEHEHIQVDAIRRGLVDAIDKNAQGDAR